MKVSLTPPLVWRREGDSNPRYTFGRTHDFQSCPFGLSGISPIFYDKFVASLP